MSTTTASGRATLISRRDLAFLLYEWLDVQALLQRPRFAEHTRENLDDVLELAERIAAERFAPHNREADAHEPHVGADGTVQLVGGVAPAVRRRRPAAPCRPLRRAARAHPPRGCAARTARQRSARPAPARRRGSRVCARRSVDAGATPARRATRTAGTRGRGG